MVWINKETPSPLDNQAVEGLFFVIGDLFAEKVGDNIFEGCKSAEIEFPSGECFGVNVHPDGFPLVHIFEDMEIPLSGELAEILDYAQDMATQCDYLVELISDDIFSLIWPSGDESYTVFYNKETQRIENIIFDE